LQILDANGIPVSSGTPGLKPASPAKRAALERAHMNKERDDEAGIDARFKLAHGFLAEFVAAERSRGTDPREFIDVLAKELAQPVAAFISIFTGEDASSAGEVFYDRFQHHLETRIAAAYRGRSSHDAAVLS
jgi:hypothetical protein